MTIKKGSLSSDQRVRIKNKTRQKQAWNAKPENISCLAEKLSRTSNMTFI